MIQPSQLKSGTLDSSPHASASADNSDDNTSNNFVPDPDGMNITLKSLAAEKCIDSLC